MTRLALALTLMTLGCNDWEVRNTGPIPPRDPVPPVPENPIQNDRVIQVTEPAVDVLFVVDNSCSMDAEQNALANNFPQFMEFFEGSGLDYHIGVVSTDMSNPQHSGKLRQAAGVRYIDRETNNPYGVFQQMAVMGTGGDTEEQGREAAFTALELRRDEPRNEGFYRKEAALHLVFISDEDDQSGANPITRGEFREWMDNLKWAPDLVKAHGIVWVPGTNCPEGWEPGQTYANYANWTEGILFDICEDDWSPFMEELGLQTSGLKREFFLSKLPTLDPWTLDVKVEIPSENDAPPVVLGFESCMPDQDCDVIYNPQRNSVAFVEYVPPPLSIVRITYHIREQFSAVGEDVID